MTTTATTGVPPVTPEARRRAVWLLALITVIWGTNWSLLPIVVHEVSVWHFRTVSNLCAGLVLLVVARWRGLSLVVPRREWPTLMLATMFYLVLWNVASTFAAVMIPSGQAAVLGFTMPLWAALLGWMVLGQRLGPRLLAALALGAAAVVLLAWHSLGAYVQAPLGVALGLAAAISWAVGTMILKRGRVTTAPLVFTGWQLLFTCLPMAAGGLVWGYVPPGAPAGGGVSWPVVGVIAYITVVPIAVGNVAWFTVVRLLPTTVAGLSSIMVPVLAMVTGALVHGEPLGPTQFAAMACCGLALWLALGRAPAAVEAVPAATPAALPDTLPARDAATPG